MNKTILENNDYTIQRIYTIYMNNNWKAAKTTGSSFCLRARSI